MFLAQCDHLGREALIWASDLEGIVNTEAGIVLRYRCACGELAEMLTGSGSDVRVSVHLGLAA
ncbi:MAG TPA: hypothetical protein VNT92_03165 [Acidimicrobiia bacterium]|nr:hypothetical protein [Acidimicrobiia bacterium]